MLTQPLEMNGPSLAPSPEENIFDPRSQAFLFIPDNTQSIKALLDADKRKREKEKKARDAVTQAQKQLQESLDRHYQAIRQILIYLARQEREDRKKWYSRVQKQKRNIREEMENKEQKESSAAADQNGKNPVKCKTMGYYFPDNLRVFETGDIISLMSP